MKTKDSTQFIKAAEDYVLRLGQAFTPQIIEKTEILCNYLMDAWGMGKQIFICGNGGSAANALHIANDLHYGIGACGQKPTIPGMKVDALPSNPGIITCLANDTGYENIYAQQLTVKGNKNDVLLALSGSGNSQNIVNAIIRAKEKEMYTVAILAFDGGKCKDLADLAIHIPVNDMQIAEDTQLIIGHMCMQWLSSNKPEKLNQR